MQQSIFSDFTTCVFWDQRLFRLTLPELLPPNICRWSPHFHRDARNRSEISSPLQYNTTSKAPYCSTPSRIVMDLGFSKNPYSMCTICREFSITFRFHRCSTCISFQGKLLTICRACCFEVDLWCRSKGQAWCFREKFSTSLPSIKNKLGRILIRTTSPPALSSIPSASSFVTSILLS